MQTKLVEFKNQANETLRGILTLPGGCPKAGTIFIQGFDSCASTHDRLVSTTDPKEGSIFLQGFERKTTTEKKAKLIADALVSYNIASLRFDASGCGLSDGDFSKTTIAKRAGELAVAIDLFRKEFKGVKINFVAHSLGMCPLALVLDQIGDILGKMVFIAPALNQKDLVRYYFVRDSMKSKNPDLKITWDNYKQYLDEEAFLEDCRRTGRMVRENYIEPQYFLEVKDMDLSSSFDSVKDKILHVHGTNDISVPLESLNTVFPNRIIVEGGDHDLERPDLWDKWFPQALDFLIK